MKTKRRPTDEDRRKKREWYHANKERIKAQRKGLTELPPLMDKRSKSQKLSEAMKASWARRKGLPGVKLPRVVGNKVITIEKSPEEEERLRKRRAYQARLRARYKARGLTSTGRRYKRRRGTNNVVEVKPERKGPVRGHIDHCPACGEYLKDYEIAKGIRDYHNRLAYEKEQKQ